MPPSDAPNPGRAKAKNSKKEKGKRGPRGRFLGSRLELLDSHIPEYTSLKKGTRHSFWHRLYNTWWQRYPWKLDDDKEPPKDDPDKMAQLASVAPGEESLKKEVEKRLTDRLTQWFINHGTAKVATTNGSIDWFPLLQRLHQLRTPRPRRRTTVQQFMLDHPDTVNAAFVSRHADGKNLNGLQKMNIKHELAKNLLSTHYSHLKSALDTKAVIQHEADMEEWDLTLDGVSSAEDVDRVRDSLFEAVHPLIEAIGAYAGCYVSLIAGSPPKDDDKGFFTALHWWPGDHSSTQNWAKWNEDAFSSGVASPFLAYARETDQLSHVTKDGTPSDVEISRVSLPLTLPHSTPIVNSTRPTDDSPSIRIQSSAAPITSYRPLPTKKVALIPAQGTNKRKHASKSRPIRYFEDERNEEGDTDKCSGDGSSSGESVSSNAPVRAKRQRTSRIATRSSTRTLAPDVDSPNITSPPLAVKARPFLAVPGAGTLDSADDGLTNTLPMPIGSPELQVPDISTNTVDTGCHPTGGIPHASTEPPTDSGNVPLVAIPAADNNVPPVADTDVPPAADIDVPPAVDTDVPPAADVRVTTDADTELVIEAKPAAASSVATTSPPLVLPIDMGSIPPFLLSHGTGKRTVNIFQYLNEAEDARFQQVLSYYIRFEVNDRSGRAGSLSTTKRPVEISRWTGGARPADIPAYTKGNRTFSDFVGSILAWWSSLQPSWRSFKRGQVSREVRGGWDVLHAPRINGLLNVVVLVYWWGRIIEEHKPEDGIRADYEHFADDVAWVFSNLST